MKRFINLNFTDLSNETKDWLLSIARENVLEEQGDNLKQQYKNENELNGILDEMAEEELYHIDFVFNV